MYAEVACVSGSLPVTATNKLMRRQLKASYVEQKKQDRVPEESTR